MTERSILRGGPENTIIETSSDHPPRSGSRPAGSVLLVGDSPLLGELATRLGNDDVRVEQCRDATDALRFLRIHNVWVLVLLDRFDDGTGLELAASKRVRGSGIGVVLIYGRASVPDIVRAIRSGSELRLFPHDADPSEVLDCTRSLYNARTSDEMQRADRREFPRVLPEGIRLEAPQNAELVDLTPGGLAFRSDDGPPQNGPIEVTLRIGRAAALRLQGEIVRQSQDALGRFWVALRFISPPPRSRKLLLGLARRHLAAQGHREMQRQFKETSIADVVPIATSERIEAFLRRAASDNLSFSIQGATGGSTWQSPALALFSDARRFMIEPPPHFAAIAPGQTLDFLLLHEFESYLFEARVSEITPNEFSCEFPHVIYYSEKRSRIRHQLPYAKQLSARLRDPRAHECWIEFPLLEVSSSGASFQADLGQALILPGSVFDPLVIAVGETQVLSERAEVRHVTSVPECNEFKVGVRFSAKRRPQRRDAADSLRATLEGPPRRSEADRAQVVKFLNGDGEELVALLNRTVRHEEFCGPVVVILPSWGHSKESFCGYALNLIESFDRADAPVAVLRLDYTHHKGESYIPERNRIPGRETLNFTFSHALADAEAALDFCYNNPLFSPTGVTLVAPSFNGQLALHLAAREHRITHLILPMSTPSTNELMMNASGGVDYIGGALRGVRFGMVDFLGLLVDMDHVATDAIDARIAFFNDAEEDASRITCPATWLLGKHDAWINPTQVERLLVRASRADTEIISVDAGHLPTHDESVGVALEVTRAAMRQLGLDPMLAVASSPAKLEAIQRDEWARAPRARLASSTEYWQGYLLGTTGDALGFDVLAFTDAYQDFAMTQISMLSLDRSHRMLDAGAGTGQFAAKLLDASQTLPHRLDLLDLVPEALERARERLNRSARVNEVELQWHVADLQISRLAPIKRFICGEYPGIGHLRDRVVGLTHDIVNQLELEYRATTAMLVHRAIRGEITTDHALSFLDETTRTAVSDLGRAARFLNGKIVPSDLNHEHALEGRLLLRRAETSKLTTQYLKFDLLDFGDAAVPKSLPLVSSSFDRIICSLVLPYLLNPDETLAELVRALRPGGVIVISTMKPDTDISLLQHDLMEKVSAGHIKPPPGMSPTRLLAELRAYTCAAAKLLRLTDEGTFHFLRAHELRILLETVGLVDIKLECCFGKPPQAYVASGRKPSGPQ